MRNGRDRRSENPGSATRGKNGVLLVGTDQRITSGPAARTAAFQSPNTWLHPNDSRKRQILFPCTAGAVHTWLHPNDSRKRQILFPCTAGAVHTWHFSDFISSSSNDCS